MLERSPPDTAAISASATSAILRQALFFLLVGLTTTGCVWLSAIALSPGGFDAVDIVLIFLFAVTTPWFVIGFWNASIGLLVMRFARDPVAAVTPVAGRGPATEVVWSQSPPFPAGSGVAPA